jgi:uncharacterized protein (TIGR04255 family)
MLLNPMSLSFAKAPLIEIIAELRWIPPRLAIPQTQPLLAPIPLIGDAKQEEFLMRVYGEFKNLGFNSPERLAPPGFVMLLYQPVYRFRRVPDPSPVLYQVGAGIFSAHGLPPYKSWDVFSPEAERGIDALLKARDPNDPDLRFSRISLRYIDAFNQELTKGRDEVGFIKDVLGIAIELPANIVNLVERGGSPKFEIRIALPVGGGMMMNLNLSERTVNNAPSIIMDTTVSRDTDLSGDVKETMAVLHAAHEIVHKAFLELTKPIHEIMQPQEV